MADLNRRIVVTVDDSDLNRHRQNVKGTGAEAAQAFGATEEVIKRSIRSITDADLVLKRLRQSFRDAADPQARRRYAELTEQIERMRAEMIRAGDGVGRFGQSSGQARQLAFELSRGIEDLRFGFVGAANNMNRFVEIMSGMSREGKTSRQVMTELLGVFRGPAGWLTILSLAISATVLFGSTIVKEFTKGRASAKELKEAMADLFEVAFDPSRFTASLARSRAELDIVRQDIEAINQASLQQAQAGQFGVVRTFTQQQRRDIDDLKALQDVLEEQVRSAELRQRIAARLEERFGRDDRAARLSSEIKAFEELRDKMVAAGVATEGLTAVNRRLNELLEERKRLTELGVPDVISPEELARSTETLRKIQQAFELTRQFSEEEKKALADVFAIQEQITTLKQLQVKLGKEATDEAIREAEARLDVARAVLAQRTAFRETLEQAAAGFSGLVGRGVEGPLDEMRRRQEQAAAAQQKINRLIDEMGRIAARALRQYDPGVIGKMEDAQKALAKEVARSADEAERFFDALDNIGGLVRQIERIVNLFGDLSDEVRSAARGVADVLSSAGELSRLRQAGVTGLALAPSAAGIAGGVAQILVPALSSFFAGNEAERKAQIQAQKDLVRALDDARRSFDRFARDLLSQPVVGRGFSQEDIDRALEILGQAGIRDFRQGRERGALTETQVRDLIAELIERGFASADLQSAFEDIFGAGGATPAAAFQQALTLLGLPDFIRALSGQIGDFSDTFGGLIEELRIRREGLGQALDEVTAALVRNLADLEIDQEVKDFITGALEGIDLNTPQGQEALRALMDTIRRGLIGEGPLSLDSLLTTSFAELEDLLAALALLVEEGAAGVDATTATVQVQRVITDVQANAVISALDNLVFWAQRQYRLLEMHLGVGPSVPFAPPGLRPPGTEIDAIIRRDATTQHRLMIGFERIDASSPVITDVLVTIEEAVRRKGYRAFRQ